MLTIGLTGGIGSGKSNVARILGKLGAKVLDAGEGSQIDHDLIMIHRQGGALGVSSDTRRSLS